MSLFDVRAFFCKETYGRIRRELLAGVLDLVGSSSACRGCLRKKGKAAFWITLFVILPKFGGYSADFPYFCRKYRKNGQNGEPLSACFARKNGRIAQTTRIEKTRNASEKEYCTTVAALP